MIFAWIGKATTFGGILAEADVTDLSLKHFKIRWSLFLSVTYTHNIGHGLRQIHLDAAPQLN
jgi:hypothetical protein